MNVIISNKYQTLLGTLDIDVIKSINGEFSIEEILVQFKNFFYNKMIIDVTAIKGYEDIKVIQELSMNFDMSNIILLLDDSVIVNSRNYLSQLVSMGIYNFTKKSEVVKYLIDNPNQYKDVAGYQQLNGQIEEYKDINMTNNNNSPSQRVIGVVNITEHAGATTLTYLMKKHLEKDYKVAAVEIDKKDFEYFIDDEIRSISSDNLQTFITTNNESEVIIVDLNSRNTAFCTDVIYLIEPSLIKLNKLISNDKKIFESLKDQKIILNKSILSQKDISDFERESASKIFFSIPYIDDKLDKESNITSFLIALGFARLDENSKNNGILGIF